MPYEAFQIQKFRNLFQTHLEIPMLLRAIPLARGLRILEVGCGPGVALPRLFELCRPVRLVGIDIAPELIALAQARVRRTRAVAELRVADVRELPFDSASFDAVVDFGTCYHIDHPEQALREIGRVLADDGVFIHESPIAQLMAHPIRTSGRRLPWHTAPDLAASRHAGLWGARRRAPRRAARDVALAGVPLAGVGAD
jgi:ubiquinone/menaquinone biosynthesis C-methylase UbiE